MLSPRQLCQIFIPVGTILIVSLLYLLSLQPVLGFQFDHHNNDQIVVASVSDLLANRGLQEGDRVIALVSKERVISINGRQFPLSLAERKAFYSTIEDYYLQQHQLHQLLKEAVRLRLEDGREIVTELQRINVQALPFSVISTVLFGLLAWLLTMLVWIWYPAKTSAICLMVNGFGFFLMAMSSALLTEGMAVYELGFSLTLHYIFIIGHALFLLFGLAVLIYFPVPLKHSSLIRNNLFYLAIVVFCGVFLSKWQFQQSWTEQRILFSNHELYVLITGSFVISIGLCLLQWFATSGNQSKRSQLYWVIGAWMIAPIIYIMFYMLPMMLVEAPLLSRPMTWGVMFLCYGLLLIVIRRFDLLYLDKHINRATIWILISVTFIALDLLVLITLYNNGERFSFVELLLVLWIYVPFRYFVKNYLDKHYSSVGGGDIPSAINYLFKHQDNSKAEIWSKKSWSEMLRCAFKPMLVEESDEVGDSKIVEHGQSIYVEANSYSPAISLSHAEGGSRLFNREDLVLVNVLYLLFEQTQQFKSAFLSGQNEERQRVRRDLHDQIAFRLVSIVYSADISRTQSIAKETLIELRLLIKALQPKKIRMDAFVFDMRVLADNFFEYAGPELRWQDDIAESEVEISGREYVNLIAVVRELMVNIQRHSRANNVVICIASDRKNLHINVHDDGIGISVENESHGNGICNLRSRLKEIDGNITWSNDAGTLVRICVPIRI